jgi:hypothetical protein
LGAFSSHAPILPYLPKDDKNYIPIIIAIWYEMSQGELLDQGQKYIGALQKILDEHSRSSEQMEVIFVLGRLPKGWKDPRMRETGERALLQMNMRVELYQELLDNAHRAYKEFIDKRKQAGRLSRILQGIDRASL